MKRRFTFDGGTCDLLYKDDAFMLWPDAQEFIQIHGQLDADDSCVFSVSTTEMKNAFKFIKTEETPHFMSSPESFLWQGKKHGGYSYAITLCKAYMDALFPGATVIWVKF